MKTRHWAWAVFTKCPKCGGTVYMLTESTTPQEFHEGDKALCTGCSAEGEFEFDLEGDLGFIDWHNQEEEHVFTTKGGSGGWGITTASPF